MSYEFITHRKVTLKNDTVSEIPSNHAAERLENFMQNLRHVTKQWQLTLFTTTVTELYLVSEHEQN